MAFSYTKEQQEAIFDDGHNLLVSASAGSGKTTVMIERIIQLLLKNRNSENPLSITNFLVVTFTKASASDMKQKLINALSKLEKDEFIIDQIEKVSTSDISNLHSFCSRLVSSYFYEVGLDPSVHIIDDVEASFFKNKALDSLFEKKEKEGDLDFFELFDMFQKKRSDAPLREIVKRFDSNLKENIDGDGWFFDSLEKCYDENLEKNLAAKTINGYAANVIKNFREEAEELRSKANLLGAEKLTGYLDDLYSQIGSVNFSNSFAANSRNVFDIKIKTAPKLSVEFYELETQAKDLSARIKKTIENLKANFVSNDENQLIFGIKKAKEIAVKLYSLTKEFDEIYEKLKRDANGLDFNDLEHYALKILDNKEICESVRKKYRYVLVDEYQDINSVQEKIISLVSSKDNRFMVGDVKQSIYRFRFCDPDIFLDKFERYSCGGDGKLIKLNCNFRSDKKILKFVDGVFCDVMTQEFGEYDYKENARFVAGDVNLDGEKAANLCFVNVTKNEDEKTKPSGIYSVKNHAQEKRLEQNKAAAEASLVARKIKDIMAARKDVSFEDFAVLVSSRNENIDEFVETLKAFGIAVATDKKYDLMKMTHIQEIVNFVKLSYNKNDDFVLFKVLKSRMFGFLDDELAIIRKKNKTDRFFEVFYSFDECDDNFDERTLYLKDKISKFKNSLDKFSQLAKIMQIKEFVSKIISEFDLKLINSSCEGGEFLCKDIDTFISSLPSVDVSDYVNFYSNFSLVHENDCSGNAVKVMTIHKSKGIEFKFVFLINLTNEFNFKSTYQNVLFNKNFGIGVDCFDTDSRVQTSSIPISAIRLIEKRKLVEEQQRVLYVAMTRAVEKLFVICSQDRDKLRCDFPKHPTAFIDWFAPLICDELSGNHHEILNFEQYEMSELLDIPEKETKQLLFWEGGKCFKPNWFEYKFSEVSNIPLKNSISKIMSNLSEDEVYEEAKFSNELSSSADRGTLYHKILQKVDLKNLTSIDLQIENICKEFSDEELKLIDKNKLKNIFDLEFFKQIESDDIILQEREFYAKMPASMIEKRAQVDEFIMQGIIDLLIIKDNEIWILDYKTGRCSDEKLAKYKIQIDAYADVVSRAFGKIVTRKVLCFVDEQKNIEI